MTQRAQGSLYDSEAALRLVDSTLQEMTGVSSDGMAEEPVATRAPEDLSRGQLAARLEQGYAEVVRTIQVLRQARRVLEHSGAGSAKAGHDELHRVPDASGVLATDLLASQRLTAAAAVLSQVEVRLISLCAVLDPSQPVVVDEDPAPASRG